MHLKPFVRQGVTLGLLLSVLALYPLSTLAATGEPIGEVTLSQTIADGSTVLVNDEPAASGRTFFNGSTFATPATGGATLNLGTVGRISLAPNTVFTVNVAGDAISASLTAGSITVLSSAQAVAVTTLAGDTLLNAGDSALANASRAARDHRDSTGKCIDDDNDGKLECDRPLGLPRWGWVAIIGGAATAIIIAAAASGDDDASPTS